MGKLTVLMEGPAGAGEVEVVWTGQGVEISAEGRRRIDEQWERYVRAAAVEGRTLFNGGVTRLVGMDDLREEGGGVRLFLGPGDYKTFLVTAMRDRAWFLEHAPEAMTFALGNSVLLTRGDRALLGIRSMRTSAYGRRAHLIGGVLELLGSAKLPATVEGVLAHLRSEMQEEAAIGEKDLAAGSAPVLLAVGRDEFLAQPELIWQWELGVELEEVAARLDAHEHEGAILVEKAGVGAETYKQMTPLARAAWERWRLR